MDKIKQLETLLESVCKKYEDDCTKCPYRKECDEYAHITENQERKGVKLC